MSIAQVVQEMKESNYIAVDTNSIVGNIHEHLEAESIKEEQRRLDDLESQRDNNQSGAPAGAPAGSGGGGGGGKKDGAMAKSIASAVGSGVKVGAMGVGAGVGLAALGFGIGGFFTGLAMGDKAQALINTDMQATKRNMITLGEALAETPERGLMIMGGIMAGGGILGALAGVGNSMKAAAGMTAMGAGIGGFFAGLALGDAGMNLLETDGAKVAGMMKSVGEGLNAFSDSSLIALGAIFAASKLLGNPKGVVAMTLMGAAVGGFFGSFAGMGKIIAAMGITGEELAPLLKNTAEGLNPLTEIDGVNLLAVGGGMIAVGAGIAALYGAKGIGAIGDLIGGAMDWIFGKSEDDDIFTKTRKSLDALDIDPEKIGRITLLASAFNDLGAGIANVNSIDFDNYSDQMTAFSEATAKTIYLLNAMWEGSTVGSGWFDGLPEMNFQPGLKSGVIEDATAQLTGISQIAGVQPNTAGQTITTTTTTLTSMNNKQAPVIVSAPTSTVNNSAPMSLSIGGSMSSMDTFDQGTR
jgi:hypothetical protein